MTFSKLLRIYSGTVLLLGFVLSAVIFYTSWLYVDHSTLELQNRFAKAVANSLVEPVTTNSFAKVQSVFDSLSREFKVSCARLHYVQQNSDQVLSGNGSCESDKSSIVPVEIFSEDDLASVTIAQLTVRLARNDFDRRNILSLVLGFLLIAGFLALILPWGFGKAVSRRILRALDSISAALTTGHIASQPILGEGLDAAIFANIRKLRSDLEESKNKLLGSERDAALGKLAQQIAHDIRSPLAALQVALDDLSLLSEDKRQMIRISINRIRDIANNLTVTGKQANDKTVISHILATIIDDILTEKRLQFRHRLGLNIEFIHSPRIYAMCAQIQPMEFKRALSNLIDNAAEAIPESGQILLSIDSTNDMYCIKVIDNGVGISPSILGQLGTRGATFGKLTGSGLGIYHARQTLESFGGHLEISSQLRVGTTVTLSLPKSPPPPWFMPVLRIPRGGTVHVLDDDLSIHQVWNTRLVNGQSGDLSFSVRSYSNPKAFFETNPSPAKSKGHVFLVDYEFSGVLETGLDFIERIESTSISVLVTSRHEEPQIQHRCIQMGLRMIPKGMASFVPIEIV